MAIWWLVEASDAVDQDHDRCECPTDSDVGGETTRSAAEGGSWPHPRVILIEQSMLDPIMSAQMERAKLAVVTVPDGFMSSGRWYIVP